MNSSQPDRRAKKTTATENKFTDVLIVHVPAQAGNHYYVMQMAVGLVPISEHLRQAGLNVEVVHLGLERFKNPAFSLPEYASTVQPRIVAFSVQWHWQLGPSCKEAAALKAARPDTTLVFGGLTASVFANEIISQRSFVDFVIRGDGEIPLLDLCNSLPLLEHPESIPNIVWRKNGQVKSSDKLYVADTKALNAFLFGVSPCVRLLDLYLKTGIEDDAVAPQFIADPAVTLTASRGCIHTCSFCAGSRKSMELATGRTKVAWAGWQSILRTIKQCRAVGVKHFYLSADIATREACFLKLLAQVSNERPLLRLDIESWSLPSEPFLKAFQRSLDEVSCLVLSPTCGSEAVRRANRTCYYSNSQYEEWLQLAEDLHIRVWLYFTFGLPFESKDDVEWTRRWQERLQSRFRCIQRIETQPLSVEPGSPMLLNPKAYGITLLKRTLDDFEFGKTLDGAGYVTSALTASEIREFAKRFTANADPAG